MTDVHENQQSFERILEIGRRRAWIGLGVFLLGAALTLTFIWALPPLYQASVTLEVAGARGHSGNSVGDPPSLGAVTQQVLRRDNLESIVTRFNLFPGATKDDPGKGMAGRLRNNITIEKNQTNIAGSYRKQTIGFTLSYSDWDPGTAAAVTNALAKSYQETAGKLRAAKARQSAEALSASMAVVGKKLAKQQKEIHKFNQRHLGSLPQQKQLSTARLSRLYTKLRADQKGELDAINRRSELLRNMNSSGTSTLPQLKEKLRDLKLRYTDEYPAVVNLKRKIKALENQGPSSGGDDAYDSSLQAQLDDVNRQLRQYKADEMKVQAEIESLQRSLSMLPVTDQKLRSLTRGNAETSDVYASLLKQYEQARAVAATAGKGTPLYSIIDPALVPQSPLGPKRLRFGIMFIILCAIVALAAVFVAEKRDTSFHTLDELRAFTSIPILTTVPVIRRKGAVFRRLLRVSAMVVVLVVGMAILGGVGYVAGHGNQAISQALTSRGS